MSHLAVDPGKKAGWAVWFEDRLAKSGTVRGDSVEEVEKILRPLKVLGTMVIEDTFIATHRDKKGRTKPRNPKGIKTLLYRRHIWEIQAQQLGMKVELANPKTWQAYFKIRGGKKTDKNATKDAIRKLAQIHVGREVLPDEADAILIAFWYAAQEKAKKVVGSVR